MVGQAPSEGSDPGTPPMTASIDHILWAAPDLDEAIAAFHSMTGVRPAPGGDHPGRGTRNALAALGPAAYLEIIAPDPAQDLTGTFGAKLLSGELSGLIGVMLASVDLKRAADLFDARKCRYAGPFDAERVMPNGKTLRWRLLIPERTPWGLCAPAVIDWLDTPNPAIGAPAGCRLACYRIGHPDGNSLADLYREFGAPLDVFRSDRPIQIAELASPIGPITLTGTPHAAGSLLD